MKRADELFAWTARRSSSSLISTIWQTESVPAESFISVAVSHWEMVVTRQGSATWLTVRGPETKATLAPIPQDAEFFGIQFSLGTFMPSLPLRQLVDRSWRSPMSHRSFWLDGSTWELPDANNADVFVDRLARAGVLVHDPVAAAAVHGDVGALSARSVERRVARATGLTRGTIGQIGRAERAVALLRRGVPAGEVPHLAGYADQPHLSRSLQRFVGQTPAQVAISV
jgi:hypothetical protein